MEATTISNNKTTFWQSEIPPKNQITYDRTSNNDINELRNDIRKGEACVVWYCGTNGLKKDAVAFYKELLTDCLKEGAIPYLVDLTAWNAFKNKRCLINGSNKAMRNLHENTIKLLKCSDYFTSLQAMSEGKKDYALINEIIQRKELLTPSIDFKESGISLGDAFDHKCAVLESIYALDCAKSYSLIQYIEFLFLVEAVLKEDPQTKTIKFILPNDEDKYYSDKLASDLERFLTARGHPITGLAIQIDCFNYSTDQRHRPYNAPSPCMGKLALDNMVDTSELEYVQKTP